MFHPALVEFCNNEYPDFPMEVIASRVDPEHLGLPSRKALYSPVAFTIAVAGQCSNRQKNLQKLEVPVFENPKWREDLLERVSDLVGQDIRDLKTPSGKSIFAVPDATAPLMGKLDMFNERGQKVRTTKLPTIPVEYSMDKRKRIKEWYMACARELPRKIEQFLQAQPNAVALDEAIQPGGALQQMVADYVSKSSSDDAWSEFVRRHNAESPMFHKFKNGEQVSREVANKIGEVVQQKVHSYLSANAQAVYKYFSHKSLGSKSVFAAASLDNSTKSGDVFRRIASSTFDNGETPRRIMESIYFADLGCCSCETKNKKKKSQQEETTTTKADIKQFHPVNSFIHGKYRPIMGALPAYVGLMENSSPVAPYPGNSKRVLDLARTMLGLPVYAEEKKSLPLPMPKMETFVNAAPAVVERKLPDLNEFHLVGSPLFDSASALLTPPSPIRVSIGGLYEEQQQQQQQKASPKMIELLEVDIADDMEEEGVIDNEFTDESLSLLDLYGLNK